MDSSNAINFCIVYRFVSRGEIMVGYEFGNYFLKIINTDDISFEVPCGLWAPDESDFQNFKPIIVSYASSTRDYIEFRVI